MLQINDKAVPNSQVIVTELPDDQAVLLDLESRQYFSLNTSGLWIWREVEKGAPLKEIYEKMNNEFDVTPEKAKDAVLNLISQLQNEALVTIEHE